MRYSEYLERCQFSQRDLIASSQGNLVDDPPEAGVARLPAPPFLMFDRITDVERGGRGGRIAAELDIRLDAWYFQCHFPGDPVQPGCLGVDAIWQLLGFYASICGAAGTGRALGCQQVEFLGQIRPNDKIVSYHVDIKRLMVRPDAGYVIGDGTVAVDGVGIYHVRGAKVGVFHGIRYGSYPHEFGPHARGGVMGENTYDR